MGKKEQSPAEKLTEYLEFRVPYRGDRKAAARAADWAFGMLSKDPLYLAAFLVETVNERNALKRRLDVVAAAVTSDFVEDAPLKAVEQTLGRKLRRERKEKR